MLVVFEEEDALWHYGQGTEIDRADVDPRTHLIRFRLRRDGPS